MSNQMQYYRDRNPQNNFSQQQQPYPDQHYSQQSNQQWDQRRNYNDSQYRNIDSHNEQNRNNYNNRNNQLGYDNTQNNQPSYHNNYNNQQNEPLIDDRQNYDSRQNNQQNYDSRQNTQQNYEEPRSNFDHQNNRDYGGPHRNQEPEPNYRSQQGVIRNVNNQGHRSHSPERSYDNNNRPYFSSHNTNDNNFNYERNHQSNERNSYPPQQSNQPERFEPEPIVKRPQILAQTTRNADGGAAVFGVVAKVDPPLNSPQSPNRPSSHPQQTPYYNPPQPNHHENNRSNYLTPIIEQPTPPASPRFNEANNYNNNSRDRNYKDNNYPSNQPQYNSRPQQFDPNYDSRPHDLDRPYIDDSSGYGSTHTERSNEGPQQFYNNSRDYDPKFLNNAPKSQPVQVQRPLPVDTRSPQGGFRSPNEEPRSPNWHQGGNNENRNYNQNQGYRQNDNRDNRKPVRHWTLTKDNNQQHDDGVDRSQIKGVKNVKSMFEKPGSAVPLPQPSSSYGGNKYNNNSRPVPPRPRMDPPESQSYGNQSFNRNQQQYNNPPQQYEDRQSGKPNFDPPQQYNNPPSNEPHSSSRNDRPPNRDSYDERERFNQRLQSNDGRYQSGAAPEPRFHSHSNATSPPLQNNSSSTSYGPPIQMDRPPERNPHQSRPNQEPIDSRPITRGSMSPQGHRSYEPQQNNRGSRSPEGHRSFEPRQQHQSSQKLQDPTSRSPQGSYERSNNAGVRSPPNERSFAVRSHGQNVNEQRALGYIQPPAQHSQSMGNLTRVTSPGNSQRNSYSGEAPMVVGVRFQQDETKPGQQSNQSSSESRQQQKQHANQQPYQQQQQDRSNNREFEQDQRMLQNVPGTENRPVSYVSDQQRQDDFVPNVVRSSYKKFSQSETDLRSNQQNPQDHQQTLQPSTNYNKPNQHYGNHNQTNDGRNQQYGNQIQHNEPIDYRNNQNKPAQQNQPVSYEAQHYSANSDENWPTPPSSMLSQNQPEQDYQPPNKHGQPENQQLGHFEPNNMPQKNKQSNNPSNKPITSNKPRPVYYQNKSNNNQSNQIYFSNQPHSNLQPSNSQYTTRQPPSGSDHGVLPPSGGSRSHPRHPFDPVEDDDSSEGIDVDAPTPPPQQQGWRHSGKWDDHIGGSPSTEGQRPVPAGERFQRGHKYERQPGDGLNDDWNYNQQNYNNAKPMAPRKPSRSSLKQQSPEKNNPPELVVEPATPLTTNSPQTYDDNDQHKLSHAYSKDRLRVVKNMSRKPPSRQGSSSTLVADVAQENGDDENYEITVTTNDLQHTSISSSSNISVQQQQQTAKHRAVQPPSQKSPHKNNYNPEPQVPVLNNIVQQEQPPAPIEKPKPSKIVFKKPSADALKPVLPDIQEPVSESRRRPPTYTGFGNSPPKPKTSLGADLLGQFKHAQESAMRSAAKKQDKALKSLQAITKMKRSASPTKKPKETVVGKNMNKIMQNRDDNRDVYSKNKPRSSHRDPEERSTSVRSSSTATGRREDSGSDEESFRRGRTNQSRRGRGHSQGNPRDARGRSRSRDRITSPSRGRSRSRERMVSPEGRGRDRSRERELDRGGHARKSERYHEPVSPYRGERGGVKNDPGYPRRDRRGHEPDWVGQYRERRPPGDSPQQRRAWVNDPRWKPKKEFDIEEYERDVRRAVSYNSDFEQPTRPRQQMIPNKLMAKNPRKGNRHNDDWMRNLKEQNKKANRHRFGNAGLK